MFYQGVPERGLPPGTTVCGNFDKSHADYHWRNSDQQNNSVPRRPDRSSHFYSSIPTNLVHPSSLGHLKLVGKSPDLVASVRNPSHPYLLERPRASVQHDKQVLTRPPFPLSQPYFLFQISGANLHDCRDYLIDTISIIYAISPSSTMILYRNSDSAPPRIFRSPKPEPSCPMPSICSPSRATRAILASTFQTLAKPTSN